MVQERLTSNIPARLDRLPWSAWHWRVVTALGIAWMLDGLEVTLVGSVGSILERPDTLGLSAQQIGWAGSGYVGGAVIGALIFGRLADSAGRKQLFLLTLLIYVAATLASAFSYNFTTFLLCRFFTGFGIGGEYAAINSAIDELVPARVRGRVSLAINGSFWIGAAVGAGLSLVLLDTRLFPADVGWRIGFGLGALLAIAIILVRRNVPESPRWLLIRGRHADAERVVSGIELAIARQHGALEAPGRTLSITLRRQPSLREFAQLLLRRYPDRTLLGLSLMVSQAFFYNAIFFTYALVLTRFQNVSESQVGRYIFPFAIANFLGPLLLGSLFDRFGRRMMIALTYGLSGMALAATGFGFVQGWLDAMTQTICWSVVFFLASAAASSAYLTVSEVFPLELRALSISVFYAVGTGIGGFIAPAFFGMLIATGSRNSVFIGYAVGAILVIVAAAVALRHAVDAERKSLEEVAAPLSASQAREP